MAYNSDGYIMIDFSMVDFRKTNQTIDGLFERCKNVIGTNKFVIVINANNKTPLPSTVSITNGQYVIESVLYTFSISSVDNLHITKKTNADELIDDDHVTLKTTFSSNKIMALFGGVVKSFTYTGNGSGSRILNLPSDCHYILSIWGKDFSYSNYNVSKTDSIALINSDIYYTRTWLSNDETWNNTSNTTRTLYNATNHTISFTSGAANVYAANANNGNYTVYYI